jgi:hypothetical protein
LIETAIVVPFMLFVFLVLLQLMLIAHARVLLDYAAFNAARAGVVHNGNPTVMKNAALLSMLPAFGPVDTPQNALKTWSKVQAWAQIGGIVDAGTHLLERMLGELFKTNMSGIIPDVSVVSVDILNPGLEDFRPYNAHPGDHTPNPDEIDFDAAARLDPGKVDPDAVRKTRLTVRVQWLFLMRVPLANQLLYYMYLLKAFTTAKLKRAEVNEWYTLRLQSGQPVDKAIEQTDLATFDFTKWPNGWKAAIRDQLMFQALKRLPGITSGLGLGAVYIMPLYTITSMPMESNLYRRYLE